jgi:hypothetical protein
MIVGVERYRLKLKDLASELEKSPDGMTKTLARAIRRRRGEDAFRKEVGKPDQAAASGDGDA